MALHHETRREIFNDADEPSRGGNGTERQRLILAHGFTQNTRCWGRFGELLAADGETVFVDAPGHGRSYHDDADLPAAAGLLTEAGGAGVYVGYSMGGRMALHAALTTPELVRGLVLIGATAGMPDASARADRRVADSELADRLERDGLVSFLDRWLAGPLFAGLDDEQAAKAHRLENRPEGLAASLRNCGTGTQEPLWGRLAELTMPVLIIVGNQDERFTEIGGRMVTAMTGTTAELVSLPGTHAIHLEQPEAAAATVLAWIR